MSPKSVEFWKNVIFPDESKLHIFGLNGNQIVWLKPITPFQIKIFKPTVEHSGWCIMIWGSVSFNRVGEMAFIEGNMNAKHIYLYTAR